MEDFRTSYATSGQVVDLWRVIEGLRVRLETLTSRLESLEGHGAATPMPEGSDPAAAPRSRMSESGARLTSSSD